MLKRHNPLPSIQFDLLVVVGSIEELGTTGVRSYQGMGTLVLEPHLALGPLNCSKGCDSALEPLAAAGFDVLVPAQAQSGSGPGFTWLLPGEAHSTQVQG